ncbi:dihydroorotase [Lewinellaceae bacterium SD302]|nr:dihydroorotase [Lewinellaceae bacterium SD302]
MKSSSTLLIKGGTIVNRGKRFVGDIYVKNGFIEKIAPSIDRTCDREIDATGLYVLPGIIDDQVHFREPGMPHKANIGSEARAAVAGGTTSFMEMPNVKPPTLTQELLQAKYDIGAATSIANYSFYMGASNDNLDEVMRTDPRTVCGLKIFMGSSTGNMLVDSEKALENLFSQVPMLIATHCEDEQTIRANTERLKAIYGERATAMLHPIVRNPEGCYLSSSKAVGMAKRFNTRLHILHISTADEIALFRNDIPLEEKRITAEVCVHHMTFNSDDYHRLGNQIKCNPAIKGEEHRSHLLPALLDDRIDVIATDHAPHTWEEKSGHYWNAPGGLPLVQHSLDMMMRFEQRGEISLEKIVEKMCHAVATCYQVDRRGYLDEGYWADIVLYDPKEEWTVAKDNIHYHVGWSPLEGTKFKGRVKETIVSGRSSYRNGKFDDSLRGERVLFDR